MTFFERTKEIVTKVQDPYVIGSLGCPFYDLTKEGSLKHVVAFQYLPDMNELRDAKKFASTKRLENMTRERDLAQTSYQNLQRILTKLTSEKTFHRIITVVPSLENNELGLKELMDAGRTLYTKGQHVNQFFQIHFLMEFAKNDLKKFPLEQIYLVKDNLDAQKYILPEHAGNTLIATWKKEGLDKKIPLFEPGKYFRDNYMHYL